MEERFSREKTGLIRGDSKRRDDLMDGIVEKTSDSDDGLIKEMA
jgi:hypothetical protein